MRMPPQSPTSRPTRLRLSTREELLRSCSAIPDVARNAFDPKLIFVEELGGTFAHYYETNITTMIEAKHATPKSATSSPSEKDLHSAVDYAKSISTRNLRLRLICRVASTYVSNRLVAVLRGQLEILIFLPVLHFVPYGDSCVCANYVAEAVGLVTDAVGIADTYPKRSMSLLWKAAKSSNTNSLHFRGF